MNEVQLNETKNDFSEVTRKKVVGLLQPRLAGCIDLQLQAKQAHWNLKGPNFIAIHELFDKFADELSEYADLQAERIVQLGGVADGTLQTVSASTQLPAYPVAIQKSEDHLEVFTAGLSHYGASIRKAIDEADGRGWRPGHSRPLYRGVAGARQDALVC